MAGHEIWGRVARLFINSFLVLQEYRSAGIAGRQAVFFAY
jgi:hypothetical protein